MCKATDCALSAGGKVLGGNLVTGLQVDEAAGEVTAVEASDRSTGTSTVYPADAVVFAVSSTQWAGGRLCSVWGLRKAACCHGTETCVAPKQACA